MSQPDPNKRIKTNLETWRKRAAQIVVVRHGTAGGIHAEMVATCATPELTTIILNELAKSRPYDERIYAFAPDSRSAIAPKIALQRAIDDYANGGMRGIPGQLL